MKKRPPNKSRGIKREIWSRINNPEQRRRDAIQRLLNQISKTQLENLGVV